MNAVVVVEKCGVGDKELGRGPLIIEELIGDFHRYRKKWGNKRIQWVSLA